MEIAVIGLGGWGRISPGGSPVAGTGLRLNRSPEKALDLAREDPRSPQHPLWPDSQRPSEAAAPAWVMVPAGKATDELSGSSQRILSRGDVIIDGGNSNFRIPWRGPKRSTGEGLHFVDAGTSGGIHGPHRRLQHDGGRREARRGSPPPRFRDACALAETRLGARGAGRLRPLRQDGPQRHRVRPHAGLRRGLRDPQGPEGLRPRPAPGRRDLALRERRSLLAPRPHRREPLPKIRN